jgi:hypothetical protein
MREDSEIRENVVDTATDNGVLLPYPPEAD